MEFRSLWGGVVLLACVMFSATAWAAAQSVNSYGGVQGFSGDFDISKWSTGSNAPGQSLVDTSHAPDYVVLSSYAAWAVSGATMQIAVPSSGTVSFKYTYNGASAADCPFVFTVGNLRTILSGSSGYQSFMVPSPNTEIRFGLNGQDTPTVFGCKNPSGTHTTLKISDFNFLPFVLIRPFGDSITYGLGSMPTWTYYDYCPLYPGAIPNKWCAFPPADDSKPGVLPADLPGGYRAWMTEYAIKFQSIAFRTEGYQNGFSSAGQWLTSTQAYDGYPGFCTTGTSDPTNHCSQANLSAYSTLPSFADITLVHAGTNDIGIGKKSASETMSGLNTIIKNLLANGSRTHIFVAKIIPIFATGCTANCKTNVDKYNGLIQSAYGNGQNPRVTVVDMASALNDAKYYSDGVHPKTEGYQRMACTWIRAIRNMQPNSTDPCSTLVP